MSALGWGIAVGGSIAAITFTTAAIRRNQGTVGWSIFGGSVVVGFMLGMLPIPTGFGWLAFCGPTIGLPVIFHLAGMKAIREKQKARETAAALDVADKEARKQKIKASGEAKDNYFTELRTVWSAQNECVVNLVPAIFAMNNNCSAISIMPYVLGEIFEALPPIHFSLESVFSAEVRWKELKETFFRTEVVPISSTNKRSPVGRALVGAVLLGPAGLVIGAASGLGGKTTITSQERKVLDERIVKGKPTLVIGTTDPNFPVVEVSFRSDNVPDHWLGQIRAAKARAGRPLAY